MQIASPSTPRGKDKKAPFPAHTRTKQIFSQPDLTSTERLVLLALSENTDRFSGEAYTSHAKLAGLCSFSRRTVIRALQSLEQAGLIDRRLSGGVKTTRYRLKFLQPTSDTIAPVDWPLVTESHQRSDRESPEEMTESHRPSDTPSHNPDLRPENDPDNYPEGISSFFSPGDKDQGPPPPDPQPMDCAVQEYKQRKQAEEREQAEVEQFLSSLRQAESESGKTLEVYLAHINQKAEKGNHSALVALELFEAERDEDQPKPVDDESMPVVPGITDDGPLRCEYTVTRLFFDKEREQFSVREITPTTDDGPLRFEHQVLILNGPGPQPQIFCWGTYPKGSEPRSLFGLEQGEAAW